MVYSEEKRIPTSSLPGSLFRLVGYSLLLLTLFDAIEALVPLRLSDPKWQFQLVGAFVERAPVPLLGMMLVFYGNTELRARWERICLNLLSWIALLAGVFYFLLILVGLMMPLEISRLDMQANAQLTQQIAQVQVFRDQLSQAQGKELESLLKVSNIQDRAPGVYKPEDLKGLLLEETANAERNLRAQAETTQQEKQLGLRKRSIKWSLGALVTGLVFIRIWQTTRWARQTLNRKRGIATSRMA